MCLRCTNWHSHTDDLQSEAALLPLLHDRLHQGINDICVDLTLHCGHDLDCTLCMLTKRQNRHEPWCLHEVHELLLTGRTRWGEL